MLSHPQHRPRHPLPPIVMFHHFITRMKSLKKLLDRGEQEDELIKDLRGDFGSSRQKNYNLKTEKFRE
ncbi:hypothetical protein TSUD_264730 [Trifolium subterraneum]|uniref:Uncharacterized protein n=1 Tax=Trifolium subterraneum TaxID=3900 RepID=A0A2Z6MWA3_TRISU|nr:hypothetical protein TSUD_264730 [Trifolium subterraneum]